ncbi:MAG: hypothetical protein NTY32_11645 [Bacteroidia bacterium]|nr:hypothetical protein [Bacteroidia bacterium]
MKSSKLFFFPFLCFVVIMCKEPVDDIQQVQNTSIKRTFTAIDTFFVNPSAGFYRWLWLEVAPVASIDRYSRVKWSELESSEGVYTFSQLENDAQAAKTDPDGPGTLGFGIMPVFQDNGRSYPAYIDAKMTSWVSAKKNCTVPDWNNPYFLERVDSLLAALGRKFNNDPRIGSIDIRSYGNWGEWHLSGFEAPPSPLEPITLESKKRIIDSYIKAFPNKQLLMMSDGTEGMSYAMSITGLKYPIGWRRDSWGNSGFHSLKNSAAWGVTVDRWKTAPVVIEGYGGTGVTNTDCPGQVLDYHASAISNGNIGDWRTLSATAKTSMFQCAKIAGYHYVLRSFDCADCLIAGKSNFVKTVWSNTGVAPTYKNWNVVFRLYNPSTNGIHFDFICCRPTVTFQRLINRKRSKTPWFYPKI